MRLSSILAGCVFLAAVSLSLTAQETLPQGVFEASVDVELINVEAFVSDDEGAPVLGLTIDDFEIFENGHPVPISNFYAVEGGTPRRDTAYGTAAEDSPRIDTGLRLVFLVDFLHLQPEHRQESLSELAAFARRHLRPGDQAMVLSHDGEVRIEQRFTADAHRVATILEGLAEGNAGRSQSAAFVRDGILQGIANVSVPEAWQTQGPSGEELAPLISEAQGLLQQIHHYAQRNATDTFRTLDRLQAFFDTLAGVPGRKAVVFLSEGLPLRPGEVLYRAWDAKFSFLSQRRDISRQGMGLGFHLKQPLRHGDLVHPTVHETGSFNAAWAFRELGRKASQRRIAFYSLAPNDAHRSLETGQLAEIEAQGAKLGGLNGRVTEAASAPYQQRRWMRELALTTGGFAAPRPGCLTQGLHKLEQDLGSFYSFGFFPRPSKDPTAERRIEIKPKRSGYRVRHRSSYGTRSRQQVMSDRILASLVHETTENPLGVAIDLSTVHFDEQGHQRLPILVKIPVESLVLLPVEDHYEGRISIHVGARDPAGQTSPIESVQVDIRVPSHHLESTTGQARVFGHHLMLEMSPGEHWVAVGVRDEVGNTEATTLVQKVENVPSVVAGPHP